jgi:hypothetical protein
MPLSLYNKKYKILIEERMDLMDKIFQYKPLILATFLLLVLVGCNSATEDANPYNFPDYVLNATYPGAMAAYEYAVDAEDGILEHIPCYCNCYVDPFNHMDVKDCFISNTESTDELIVYDPHGAG